MITENVSTLKIHKLTQEQYNRELEAGRIDENAIYLTPDEEIDLSPYATIEDMNGKADEVHSHAISDVNELQVKLDSITSSISTKANSVHSHIVSDVTDLQNKLDEKVSVSRTINGKELTSNITLSASDVGADASGTASTQVGTHNTATTAHNDIRVLITDLTTKLNNFLDVDDTTSDQLSEVLEMINNNKGTLESLTTSKVNVSDIIDNLETAVSTKVLSANQGVEIKKLIDALQISLNNKANASALNDYYTKTEIDNMELITIEDIDAICGQDIEYVDLNEGVF